LPAARSRFLHGGYAVLTGLTATTLYMLAGAAWMYLKFDGGPAGGGIGRAGRSLTIVLAIAVAACLGPPAGRRDDHTGGRRAPVAASGPGSSEAAVLVGGLAVTYRSFGPAPRSRPRVRRARHLCRRPVCCSSVCCIRTWWPPNITVARGGVPGRIAELPADRRGALHAGHFSPTTPTPIGSSGASCVCRRRSSNRD